MSTLPEAAGLELDRVRRGALLVGGAALAVCVPGAFFSPTQFFRAYLAVYAFLWGLGLGGLAILMMYFLTGGAWGFIIRRTLEAMARTLPLLAVLFLPIAFGIRDLYPWAGPEGEELHFNRTYLNPGFFWVRAAVYFACWIAVAFIVNAWSRREDVADGPTLPRKFRLLSAPGLMIYGLGVTFASIDWVMSLQPKFRSTIFGPATATGQLLSAQALALVVLAWLVARPPVARLISVETLNDLGNLLFTFLILWAYMTFAQLLLIWMANVPDEVIWYLPRVQGGWRGVAWALFLFHFVVPFFALLMRDVKRDPAALARVAGLLLVMQLVFNYYQVLPAFPDTTLGQHWMDFLMPFGLGGLWLAYFLWQLRRYPLLPRHDQNRAEAARLHGLDVAGAARAEAISHG